MISSLHSLPDGAGDRRTVVTPSDPLTVESVDIQMQNGAGMTVRAINATQSIAVNILLPAAFQVKRSSFIAGFAESAKNMLRFLLISAHYHI